MYCLQLMVAQIVASPHTISGSSCHPQRNPTSTGQSQILETIYEPVGKSEYCSTTRNDHKGQAAKA